MVWSEIQSSCNDQNARTEIIPKNIYTDVCPDIDLRGVPRFAADLAVGFVFRSRSRLIINLAGRGAFDKIIGIKTAIVWCPFGTVSNLHFTDKSPAAMKLIGRFNEYVWSLRCVISPGGDVIIFVCCYCRRNRREGTLCRFSLAVRGRFLSDGSP